MEIETTKTHLQSISTFLSMFHIFSHTEELPGKKKDREKKGLHDFDVVGQKLWTKKFEVEEVNPEEANQKKFLKIS